MRRLTNNWLFGQVSPLLSGRLDSDVYGNSCSELLNMKAHRQGGISRRPPVKGLKIVEGYTKLIPFVVDSTHVFAVLLGAGKVAIYNYLANTLTEELTLPTHTNPIHSWANISDTQCKNVKYAQYYNDLYLVHADFPLMRIRYSSSFVISTPQVFVNQDIKPKAITLSISMTGVSATENLTFTFLGQSHSFTLAPTTSALTIINNLKAFEYEGFELTNTESTITFTATDVVGKYIQYDLTDTEQFNFVSNGSAPVSFVPTFSTVPIDEETIGTVYGSDNFPDCYLNRQNDLGVYEFASSIAIINERMFLVVNGNPCIIYASRPYSTSQIIYPSRSNDTILDFVQFELVATTNTVMKEEADLSVRILTDDGSYVANDKNTVYEGTSTDQKLWMVPSMNQITTKKSLDEYRKGYYLNGEFVPDSAHELALEYDSSRPNIVMKIKRITTTATTEEDYIDRVEVYYRTYDEEVDYSKLMYDQSTRVYTTEKYFIKNGQNYTYASASNGGSGGLKYVYEKTSDNYINSKTAYYTRSGSGTSQDPYVYTYVENPLRTSLGNYYEKFVEFTNLESIPIYEYGEQYVFSGTTEQLQVEYLENGMIGSLSYNNEVLVKQIPYYMLDVGSDESVSQEETEVDKVATSSTGIEFQLATGRNDRITWISQGEDIMVGTESAEYRINTSVNALDMQRRNYTYYGSIKGLVTNIGPDMIFVQRGNGLRLLYKDDYGLQNIEVSLTNPEILKGNVKELVGMVCPEPALYVLKDDCIINVCVDRANGVQAFAKWTFNYTPLSICVLETEQKQVLISLFSSEACTFIGEFDTDEDEDFSDCDSGIDLEDEPYLQNHSFNYLSRMTANPFDTVMQDGSVTIGEAKNVSKMIFRCYNTGFIRTYFNKKDQTVTRTPICCGANNEYEPGLADHSVNVNGGTTRDLMITVESVDDNPMTLLAMAYELRLNKNG